MTFQELKNYLNSLPDTEPALGLDVHVLMNDELHPIELASTASENVFFVPDFPAEE